MRPPGLTTPVPLHVTRILSIPSITKITVGAPLLRIWSSN